MLSEATHTISQQLSVGNALQNVAFYGMLVLFTWVVALQLQHKKTLAKQRERAR